MRSLIVRTASLLSLVLVAACAATPPPPAPPSPGPVTSAAPVAAADPHPDDAAIAKVGEEYLALFAEVHPEAATALGLHARDAELDDRSTRGFDAATDREAALLAKIEQTLAAPRASAAARTDLELVVGALRCDVRRRRVERPLQRRPQLYAEPLDAVFQMTARDYAPAADRAHAVLARLAQVPKVVELAKANLLNPPKTWTENAIDRAGSAKAFLDEQRPFLVGALPDEIAKVDATLKATVAAYDDYKRFLQREVLPKSNGRFAAGRELFEYLLKNDYFLEEGADALLAMGKKVVAETNAEMLAVAKRIDPKATGWAEVTRKLKAKHPAADEVLVSYQKEVARSRAFLVDKDVVPFPPGDDLAVVDTPVFLRSTVIAAYDPPPAFGSPVTKGFFFITPIDKALPKAKQEEVLREYDWGDIVDTTVHEAYPGHHLQLSFARKHPSQIRRAFDTAIFSEGWALYSEELMSELGYYDDAQRLIQLEWSLVRASRIVIDVGLHVGDMTFEAAVKMLTDDVHLERSLALSEVKRYTESATQPSAYMTGRQKILELRERAKARDGAKFSLKAFHGELLSRGSIAPSLIGREMFAAQ